MLSLCSAPLIALLVAGEDEVCSLLEHGDVVPCWNMFTLGYHNISYPINASIYLVKGGRLGLMPGVLFHSCRPSFRDTSVMFPDFAFLTRLGDLWDPLDSSLLNKTFPARPNIAFYHLPPKPFSLGFCRLKGHLYFKPPGQFSFDCWSKLEPFAAPPRGNSRAGFSCTDCSSGCALRPRYVQLLSGFVGTIGRLCWTCFIAVEMSCSPGFRD